MRAGYLSVPPDSFDHVPTDRQLSFDELDQSLFDTTFVVVDLETTGGSAADDAITEIGAVKVRGGVVLGELHTLVDPGRSIPPAITELTGITTAMTYDAPPIERVLPSFLEFAAGAVLVAHNAGFDIGFLRAAATRCATAWPRFRVLCTVKLARRVLSREEAPSVRLGALATLLQAGTAPSHRALDDARATVDVLHALIARVGNQGVHSYAELVAYLPGVPAGHRAKRTLAAGLPRRPGVYLFRGPGGEVLYVGTATDLQRRVRSYFTGSETRSRMREMVALAERVDHVECAHPLEAGVRELRLLRAHAPPYNRRSRFPKRAWWLTLTDEPFARCMLSRTPAPAALGPFGSRGDAAAVADTLARMCRLRTCTGRIGRRGRHACRVEPVGGCAAGGLAEPGEYQPGPARLRALLAGESDAVLAELHDEVAGLAAAGQFEAAARARDRAVALITALHRCQRLAGLAAVAELVGAHPGPGGGWELAVIRYGRLAAAGVARPGVPPMPVVEQLAAAAETVVPDGSTLHGALPDETGLLVRWLTRPGTRIVRTSDGYAEPVYGAARWAGWAARARAAADGERARSP
ncbi:DEDD exonuclease domain-containing protein [Skermania piniformis]